MNFMNWIEKQWKLVVGIFVLIILGGAAMSAIAIQKENKEHKAQEKYFMTEKKYLEVKNKATTPDPVNPASAAAAAKAAPATPADYASVKTDFETIIKDFAKSKAAQMSALYLAEIHMLDKNVDAALSTLKSVENNDAGLVNTLVQQQIGQLLADKNQCQDAVQTWEKIVKRKEASFIHNDVKIQQALCYQQMNDSKKAEEILTNLANQKSESPQADPSAKEAEKYLRLIQFKKASGS